MLTVLAPIFFPEPDIQSSRVSAAPQASVKQAGLPRSVPTQLEIPDIQLSTALIQLGKNDDGSLQVPEVYDVAGWYKFSPTPGEVGPSVIAGHVDNYLGPAVFFYLKDLQPGQRISVTREDKRVVNFRVDKVTLFDQQAFPTKEVYGNIDHPGLRLITCGGTYNVLTGHYSHNTVVYASLDES
jgi:sortase (surface protein transpeptidase)